MAVPGTFTSGQVLTAAEMNDLPAGIVGSDVLNSAAVSLTTSAQTTHTVTFTAVSGRKYVAMVSGLLEGNNTTGTVYKIDIEQDATRITAGRLECQTTSENHTVNVMAELPSTSGSTTITVDMSLSAGTGQLNASATNYSTFIVFDVGT
jgi:hypothetical protein